MSTVVGVVCFPGTNCEHDVAQAVTSLGAEARIVFHRERSLKGVDAVVIPGGFAHGDYLRPGAIARFSPVMEAISEFAKSGGPIVGVCNGFQVLTEAGLLPGALVRNVGLRFLCRVVECEVASTHSVLTGSAAMGAVLSLPINHYEGRFVCDDATLAELEACGRVVLRYLENPNGSMNAIAGIANEVGNVVGVMPHPERASDPLGVGTDGTVLFASLIAAVTPRRGAVTAVAG
ncbi:MAG: phosphoribosylformylglycinamidine synthase subunit PurQ [Acidimicrobiales bacterium]